MKILQVVHGFPPKQRAGTEIYTYYLSKELAKRHEVHVLYPTVENVRKISLNSFERGNLFIHEVEIPKNKIKIFLNLLFFENTYLNKKVEKIFIKLLKDIKPDIIHFQHLIDLSATLIDVAKEFGIPSVLTLHDYWFICPNIHLLKCDYTICKGPKPDKCRECWVKRRVGNLSESLVKFHIHKYLTRKLLEFIIKAFNSRKKFEKRNEYLKSLLLKVDKIITPSRFLREMFINYGIPEDKIIYSENGYNVKLFEEFRKREKTKNNKIVFGFVGGTAKHKGITVLLEALEKINEKEKFFEIYIYGSCDPNSIHFKRLKKLSFVKIKGKYANVKEPFSEIDVLIFPSICYENCPLTLREAMITGTPVIASNIGGIPEIIKDGINGFLFDYNKPEKLKEKILIIATNLELLEKLRKNCKKSMVKSIDTQAKELEKLYRRLIE